MEHIGAWQEAQQPKKLDLGHGAAQLALAVVSVLQETRTNLRVLLQLPSHECIEQQACRVSLRRARCC